MPVMRMAGIFYALAHYIVLYVEEVRLSMKRPYRKATLGSVLIACGKAALLACILTAVLVLLLALSMKWEWIGMERVDAVNTLIKAVSACFAGFITSFQKVRRCWLVAGLVGMGYMIAAFIVFGILNGSFAVSLSNAADVLMAFACAACTCIGVSILRERRAQKA